MKTRFKTSSKSQKQTILENSNFLNAQNYILGKSEKKKLLSKFFVEKMISNILWKINIFNIIFFPLLIIFLLINIFIFIFILNLYISLNIILIITIIIWLIISIFSNNENKDIKFEEYYFSKKPILFSVLVFLFLLIILLIIAFWIRKGTDYYYLKNYFPYINYWIIPLILLSVYFYKKTILLFRINYIWIILFPINLIIFLFYWIFIFINYSIIWTNYFSFIKYFPKKKLFKKFRKIKNNYAENKYYKITNK